MQCPRHPACTFPTLTLRLPISLHCSPNRLPVLRGRFHHHFLDLLLDEPFRQHPQLLRIAAVPASLKLIFIFDFDVSHNHGQPFFMNIDSRHSIRHKLPPGGNGERAGLTLTWVSGYRRSHTVDTTHHLFARSRTLRIKLTFGFSISTVISISPLPAVLDYYSDLSDFHRISRAEGPTQLTWMPVILAESRRWNPQTEKPSIKGVVLGSRQAQLVSIDSIAIRSTPHCRGMSMPCTRREFLKRAATASSMTVSPSFFGEWK